MKGGKNKRFRRACSEDVYQNNGIRKAIVLARYANLLKIWISDERESRQVNREIEEPLISYETGILIPEQVVLSKWERTSVSFTVSDSYRNLLIVMRDYIDSERVILGDETLEKEIEILDKLISTPSTLTSRTGY